MKAAIRYNGEGEFNNSPDNRRKGAHPDTMRKSHCRGLGAVARPNRTEPRATIGKCLPKCDSADLIYMDPPYQGVCKNRDNRYCPKIEHEEFCDSSGRAERQGLHVSCQL